MKIKTLFVLIAIAMLWPAAGLHAQDISTSLKEIEQLYKKESYSIVLEKALGLLNTKEDRLAPSEAAFLHYYIGLAYKKNDNNEMAADYFKKIEQKYPVSDYLKMAYMELADIFKQDYFQKESYLEKVFNNYPRTPEALKAGIILSKGYIRLKNFKKALPVLETMVNLWKNAEENPDLNMLLAVAYSGIKDYIEAIVYLRLVEKQAPKLIQTSPQYMFEAGKICFNNVNFAKSVDYFEKLFNVFPKYKDNAEATRLLAQAYEKENKLFMSAVFLIKAIERKPPQKQLHSLMLGLGRVLGRLPENDVKKIRLNYPLHANSKKLLTLVKNNSTVFEERRTAAILLSGELKKADNIEQAVENFHKFLGESRDPTVEKMFKEDLDTYLEQLDKRDEVEQVFRAWVKLKRRKSYLSGNNLLKFGAVLVKMKFYANAEEVYRHLIKYKMFADYWTGARQQLARLCFKVGRYEDCLENLSRLNPQKEPERSEFAYYKALSYRHLKNDELLATFLGNVEITRVFTIHQYRLAHLTGAYLESQKKYNVALEYYQKMLEFNEAPQADQGQLMASVGDLYYKVEDLESALSYYRLAEQKGANLEWVLFRACSILFELGKKKEAKEVLEKLKNTNPNSFWVRQLEKNVK
jgi:tetratricopeptide (TPR) repeat protein